MQSVLNCFDTKLKKKFVFIDIRIQSIMEFKM